MNSISFKNMDDFIKFLKDHPEIETLKQFRKDYSNLYTKYLKLKTIGVITEDLPLKNARENYNLNTNYTKVEDFQKYIDDNKITSSEEFYKINKPLYLRLQRLGFYKKISFYGKLNNFKYDTLEKIQQLVYEENISSRMELKKRHIQVYRKYVSLKKLYKRDIKFIKIGLDSINEEIFLKHLLQFGIDLKDIIVQEVIGQFRFDFVFSNKQIVELHGKQHFTDVDIYDLSALEIQANDKKKKEYVESLGYKVFYFTYDVKIYEEFGYPFEVFTDIEKLILALGYKNESKTTSVDLDTIVNKIYQEEKEAFFDSLNTEKEEINTQTEWKYDPSCFKTIDDFNKFLNEFKIESPNMLKNSIYQKVYWRADKLGLSGKLKYYISPNKIIPTREFKSIEDVNNFLQDKKIINSSNWRKIHLMSYLRAMRKGWLDKINYYKPKN